MGNKLSRDQIIAADDLPREDVDVPEWGGSVTLRGLTGTQRDLFEQETVRQNGKNVSVNMENVRARLVARCLVDEKGERMFSDEDVKVLGGKSGKALERLFKVAQRLSGLTQDDVQELAKN